MIVYQRVPKNLKTLGKPTTVHNPSAKQWSEFCIQFTVFDPCKMALNRQGLITRFMLPPSYTLLSSVCAASSFFTSNAIEVSTAGSVQVGTWIDHSTWAKHGQTQDSSSFNPGWKNHKFEVVGAIHGVPYGSLGCGLTGGYWWVAKLGIPLNSNISKSLKNCQKGAAVLQRGFEIT